ncbi:MAG: helix-turn-helix transcriptional regulator [Spirochaetaceae bacterium]|nr:helix-turn-helix transcriptional regulator [Spirochaetaceae bacterium]
MDNTFWGRVLYILDSKDISRKEFAVAAGISYSSIHNGSERNSIPSADVALRIAETLETSIEYLVYGNTCNKCPTKTFLQHKDEKLLYRRNKEIIDALEEMPPQAQRSIREMIVSIKKAF